MAFIRYKQRGQKWYVYEVTNLWDKNLKKYVQTTIYLGVSNEKNGSYAKVGNKHTELGVLDFGDCYAIKTISESSRILDVIRNTIGSMDTLMTLVCYQLTNGSAMYNCPDWAEGNIVNKIFPDANLSSQKISSFINKLGNETLQRKFFKNYIDLFFNNKHGVLIDSTALPNAANTSLSALGYSSSGVVQKVGCLMLVDKDSKLPIFFRAIPGEIADISTLKTTFDEIDLLGLKTDCAIFDAGYFSEDNIRYLCEKKINFISRMPKTRNIFKELVLKAKIENHTNAVQYGKRIVFIKSQEITLYESQVFAHIILDPDKKAKDINKLMLEHFANSNEKQKNNKELKEKMKYCGYLILISKQSMTKDEVLPNYYTRQSIEQIFGFAKVNNLLPLRTHSNQSINGYLFLIFISIIIFIHMRNKLKTKMTVEQSLIILRNLKAKVYDKKIIPLEATKKMKDIFSMLGITVPISMGI
jgi:transposase